MDREENTQKREEGSLAYFIIKSQQKVIYLLAILWFATIAGFIWYIQLYDYVDETTTIESNDLGNANYIKGNGDIVNGEDSSQNKE